MVDAKNKRVLGVVAGGDMPVSQLANWAASADVIYAADGAYNRMALAGIAVDKIIGDLDSLHPDHHTLSALHQDTAQDTSDCDKLLTFAAESGHSAITLIGIEGDRLDHMLASLYSAARSELSVRIVYRTGIGLILRGPSQTQFASTLGASLSLLPLVPCEGVDLNGVRWPLGKVALHPAGQISLSNEVAASVVNITLETGVALATFGTSGEPEW